MDSTKYHLVWNGDWLVLEYSWMLLVIICSDHEWSNFWEQEVSTHALLINFWKEIYKVYLCCKVVDFFFSPLYVINCCVTIHQMFFFSINEVIIITTKQICIYKEIWIKKQKSCQLDISAWTYQYCLNCQCCGVLLNRKELRVWSRGAAAKRDIYWALEDHQHA